MSDHVICFSQKEFDTFKLKMLNVGREEGRVAGLADGERKALLAIQVIISEDIGIVPKTRAYIWKRLEELK
jgi:hypothetical protein